MEKKKIIIVDLTNCKYIQDFHLRIKEAFHFPDYYGQNWSAFWDLLREPRDSTLIQIKGAKTMVQELQDYCIDKMTEILQRNKEWQYDCDYEFID